MERNLFEVAVRSKMRFPFRGLISVEDLWDLGLTQLDSIFKTLNGEKKQTEEESLLGSKTKENQELQDKIDIIKHVVSVIQDEANARLEEKEKAEKKQKLLRAYADKENDEIKNMSKEEIEKALEEL